MHEKILQPELEAVEQHKNSNSERGGETVEARSPIEHAQQNLQERQKTRDIKYSEIEKKRLTELQELTNKLHAQGEVIEDKKLDKMSDNLKGLSDEDKVTKLMSMALEGGGSLAGVMKAMAALKRLGPEHAHVIDTVQATFVQNDQIQDILRN